MLLALLALLTQSHAQTLLLDKIEASVNKSLILSSDITQFRKTLALRAQLDPLFSGTTLAAKGKSSTQSEISQFLIDELIIAEAFPVTDAEVEQEISTIQSNNKITRAVLKNSLKEQGYDFDDYYRLIKVSLSKKNLIDREIRSKVFISEDDAKNKFLNEYLAKSGGSGFSYKIQIISVSTKNFQQPSAAKETALRAYQALKAGDHFPEVAKRFSDDPSAANGGELGTFTEDEMAPQIKEQIKKLKIGEISAVLGDEKTSFFILRLADVKSGQEDHFNKVKDEIRNQMMVVEFQHQISLWIQRQRQNSFIHLANEQNETKKI